jgi:aldehyde dehydrogenase (NAD+)
MEEAGIPPGVFNLLLGQGNMGNMLVEHPDIDLIAFTGSTSVGFRIGEICGRTNKKCSLEMGGKNAQIVMPDANFDTAADGVLWGAFGTTGQRCTATSRLIIHKDVYEDFLKIITERAEKLQLGDGLVAGNEVVPVINRKALEKIDNYVKIALGEGGCLDIHEMLTGHFGQCATSRPESHISRPLRHDAKNVIIFRHNGTCCG